MVHTLLARYAIVCYRNQSTDSLLWWLQRGPWFSVHSTVCLIETSDKIVFFSFLFSITNNVLLIMSAHFFHYKPWTKLIISLFVLHYCCSSILWSSRYFCLCCEHTVRYDTSTVIMFNVCCCYYCWLAGMPLALEILFILYHVNTMFWGASEHKPKMIILLGYIVSRN